MYNNSKIQWRSGLEMTASVFEHWRDDLDALQMMAVSAAFGEGRMGLLPGCEYRADGGFVERTFELTGFRCTAMLPSGRVISVDEDLKLEMPSLTGPSWYLCVTVSTTAVHTFEKDGIPYVRPVYELVILSPEEVKTADVLPIKHFILSDGMLNVDDGFIPASLYISSDDRYLQWNARISDRLKALAEHTNMEDGDCRRNLLHLLFRIQQITARSSVRSMVSLLQEMVQTTDYYIVGIIGGKLGSIPEKVTELGDDDRRNPLQYDIAAYLSWCEEYLTALGGLMDCVVVEDKSIDYDLLKREIRDDVYERLRAEISDQVYDDLHDRLSEELSGRLVGMLTGMLDERFPMMREELETSLHDKLYPELYDAIYQALKDLLYKPEVPEEDTFHPLI